MNRPRPYIPLSVRVEVAEEQVWKTLRIRYAIQAFTPGTTHRAYLGFLLRRLGFESAQLDHDPALILRKFNRRTGKYTPGANDPAHLIYREKADHQQKTTGRKPGAERTATTKGSDIWLKSKFNRLEGRTKPKRKQTIPSRPFSKGRKFNAR